MDMFAFEAWLAECKTIWDAIDKAWPDASDSFQLAMFSKAARPYFYYLEENANANRPTGPSPFGSERIDAGAAHERGGSATAKAETSSALPHCERCKKEFTPRVKGAKLCLDCWKKERRR